MEIPKRMAQSEEEIVHGLPVFSAKRFDEGGPLLRENRERAEPPLRVIQGAGAAEPPKFWRQHEPLHFIAMRPPPVPELSYVAARFPRVNGQIWRLEKSGHAKEQRLDVVVLFAEHRKRQPLRQDRERQFILFVTKRCGDFLKERSVAPVRFDDVLDPGRLTLEPELRRGGENGLEAFLRQIFQRRLATARPGKRHVRGKLVGQRRRIDPDLRHVAIRFRPGKKEALALLHEDMQDGVIKRGVGGMAVRFPAAIGEIEFNGAANWVAVVDPDDGIGKIGARLAVPGAELDDLDLFSGHGNKAPAEIAGKPARLQFQLAQRALGGKERAFMDARGITKLGVTAGQLHSGRAGCCRDLLFLYFALDAHYA